MFIGLAVSCYLRIRHASWLRDLSIAASGLPKALAQGFLDGQSLVDSWRTFRVEELSLPCFLVFNGRFVSECSYHLDSVFLS